MMRKLAKVGYRVAPMYTYFPNGTIVEVLRDGPMSWDVYYVMVKWDDDGRIVREAVKYLRKGV